MKRENQRIAIAEACGWAEITFTGYSYQGIRPANTKRYCNWNRPAPSPSTDDTREWHWIPDYLNDLNAMHEAESAKDFHRYQRWIEILVEVGLRAAALRLEKTDGWDWALVCARSTAAQRAESFLRTLNLWTDEA